MPFIYLKYARFSYPGLGCIHAFPRSASLGPKTFTFIRSLRLASVLKLSKSFGDFCTERYRTTHKKKTRFDIENKQDLKIWF